MGVLCEKEKKKRGCLYCTHVQRGGKYPICPYAKCPYTILDRFASYEQYLKAEGIAFTPGVVLQYIHGKV